ncbi:MAG: amino acid permease [Gammaproteobacteria bacterium]|nr:amino acid permease [Gammaproteobacteria bacterium]
MSLWRTKSIEKALDTSNNGGLHRALSGLDLTLLGIGAVIGAGIFVLTGVAAATKAGPALALSFVVSGLACIFTALVYAELASAVPISGSAYTYSYVALGEFIAWIIGWNLVLEYGVSSAAVAIGWSGYFNRMLEGLGAGLPEMLLKAPHEGGLVNLPALLIILLVSVILAIGVKHSSRFNNAIVMLKLAVIALFIVVAMGHVEPANWQPFMPFGWEGVMGGAALIFFAYIGFDAVSTAGEEARDPQRDLPRGIIASLVICTIIYIVVAALLTGLVPYTELNVKDPVAFALTHVGERLAASLISVGAIAGLTSVLLVLLYGQTRIFFAMSRDGLLPAVFSQVHAKTRTPVVIILATGMAAALVAGFMPIGQVAELANIGTLSAFVLVSIGVLVLRRTQPDLKRPFKTPFMPWTPILAILFCTYLIASLGAVTWWRFVIWTAIGVAIYFAYSRKRSHLAKA